MANFSYTATNTLDPYDLDVSFTAQSLQNSFQNTAPTTATMITSCDGGTSCKCTNKQTGC
ncbi:MAG: hypothetical protein HKM07_02120 [Chlamydiae bacterium]|nr:hypothetical protein [Chlamydiota bacterium]